MNGGAGDDDIFYTAGFDTIAGGTNTATGGDRLNLSRMTGPGYVVGGSLNNVDLVLSATFTGIEIIVGSDFNDSLSLGFSLSGAAAWAIYGNGGDDFIYYDTADVFQFLSGGAADTDRVFFGALDRPIWIDLNMSSQQAWTRGATLTSGTWKAAATLDTFEQYGGTSFDDYMKGNEAPNTFYGFDGNDTLLGMGGDDILIYSEGGRDLLDGGTGVDRVDFTLFQPVWVDLSQSSANGWVRGDTLASGTWRVVADLVQIENVTGTPYNDYLKGGTGNNVLFGDAGNDELVYFSGFDTLDGGNNTDVASFALVDKGVWVELGGAGANVWTSGANVKVGPWTTIAQLINIEDVVASAYDDVLNGNGGANTLTGGAGNDTVGGGAGNDRLIYTAGLDALDGGTDIDTVDFSALSKPVWVDLGATGNNAWTSGANVTVGPWTNIAAIATVENVDGTAFADIIKGNADRNVLTGGGGADTLTGGGNGDRFVYRSLSDISALGGSAADRITDFGTGADVNTPELIVFARGFDWDPVTSGVQGNGAVTFGFLSDRLTIDYNSDGTVDYQLFATNVGASDLFFEI